MKKEFFIRSALAIVLLLSNMAGLQAFDEQDSSLFTQAIEKPQLNVPQPSGLRAWFMSSATRSALRDYKDARCIFMDIAGELEHSLLADLGTQTSPLVRARLYTKGKNYPVFRSLVQLNTLHLDLKDLVETLQKKQADASLDEQTSAAFEELKRCVRKLDTQTILLMDYFRQSHVFVVECVERNMSIDKVLKQFHAFCNEIEGTL